MSELYLVARDLEHCSVPHPHALVEDLTQAKRASLDARILYPENRVTIYKLSAIPTSVVLP